MRGTNLKDARLKTKSRRPLQRQTQRQTSGGAAGATKTPAKKRKAGGRYNVKYNGKTAGETPALRSCVAASFALQDAQTAIVSTRIAMPGWAQFARLAERARTSPAWSPKIASAPQ